MTARSAAVVVIPARDEEARDRRAACAALGAPGRASRRDAFAVDRGPRRAAPTTTEAVARARGREHGLALRVDRAPAAPASAPPGAPGWTTPARCSSAGRADGLIACTDADTEPDAGLAGGAARARRRGRARRSAAVIDARSAVEAAALAAGALDARASDARARPPRRRARRRPGAPSTTSSPARRWRVTAARLSSRRRPRAAAPRSRTRRFARAAAPPPASRSCAPRDVRVTTSARTRRPRRRGLARDLEVGDWLARRRYDGACATTLEALLRGQGRHHGRRSSSRPGTSPTRSAA